MTERQLTLYKPSLSGDQQLFVRRIEGREAISELFAYEVILYSKSDNVDFGKVLGQDMCIGLTQAKGDKERFFNGYVASFASIGTEGGFHLYRAELRPSHWRTTRAVNCRGFQAEAVPDIISSVLNAHGLGGMVTSLSRNYLPWEYCVQYRESDFAFVSRLLEREGIHYFFKHEKDKHSLHLADTNLHETVPGYEEVAYKLDGTHHPGEETVWGLTLSKQVLTDRTTLSDYDFTKPKEPLMRSAGSEVKREHDDARDYEGYDYLETVVQQTGYSADLTEEYARIRTEEIHSHYAVVTAETNARGIQPGSCFKLKEHRTSARNIEYLVLSTHIHAEIDERGSTTGSHGELLYRCTFEAIDAKTPFRPARITPKPRMPGPQSATVAGPAGAKDIHTDQWGRVLVKFHWYRPPESIEKDISFWIRVSQNSAGANWGSMFVPHIGQEVIVSFFDGDPDRPIITGRVYNGNNKPPLELPGYAEKSIIRDHFGNEVIWSAIDGEEGITIRSPKDNSAICVGTKGIQQCTDQDHASVNLNSISYNLGYSQSYTMGSSWEVKRATSGSFALGTSFSAFVGAKADMSIASSFEFKASVSMSLVVGASAAFGYSRDFKKTGGDYTRMSDDDIQFSSAKVAYMSGGGDHTVFRADKDEISLSYDQDFTDRKGDIGDKDKCAMKWMGAMAVVSAGVAQMGTWAYEKQGMTSYTEKLDCKGETYKDVEKGFGELKDLSQGDWGAGASVLATAVGIGLTKGATMTPPEHKTPNAKIEVKLDSVRLFAGEKLETELHLTKDGGVMAVSKKEMQFLSEDDGISIKAKKEIKLSSDAVVTVYGKFEQKNLKAAK